MSKKMVKDKKKRPPAEKPISLAGAKFKDVLRALLLTKPMPKEKTEK